TGTARGRPSSGRLAWPPEPGHRRGGRRPVEPQGPGASFWSGAFAGFRKRVLDDGPLAPARSVASASVTSGVDERAVAERPNPRGRRVRTLAATELSDARARRLRTDGPSVAGDPWAAAGVVFPAAPGGAWRLTPTRFDAQTTNGSVHLCQGL